MENGIPKYDIIETDSPVKIQDMKDYFKKIDRGNIAPFDNLPKNQNQINQTNDSQIPKYTISATMYKKMGSLRLTDIFPEAILSFEKQLNDGRIFRKYVCTVSGDPLQILELQNKNDKNELFSFSLLDQPFSPQQARDFIIKFDTIRSSTNEFYNNHNPEFDEKLNKGFNLNSLKSDIIPLSAIQCTPLSRPVSKTLPSSIPINNPKQFGDKGFLTKYKYTDNKGNTSFILEWNKNTNNNLNKYEIFTFKEGNFNFNSACNFINQISKHRIDSKNDNLRQTKPSHSI